MLNRISFKVTSYPCIAESVKCKQWKTVFFFALFCFASLLRLFRVRSSVFVECLVSRLSMYQYLQSKRNVYVLDFRARSRSNRLFIYFFHFNLAATMGFGCAYAHAHALWSWTNNQLVHLAVNFKSLQLIKWKSTQIFYLSVCEIRNEHKRDRENREIIQLMR